MLRLRRGRQDEVQIRSPEAVALAQQRLAELPGERVGEAVAVVEPGGVSSLPEVYARPSRDPRLDQIDRHHFDAGGLQQHVRRP